MPQWRFSGMISVGGMSADVAWNYSSSSELMFLERFVDNSIVRPKYSNYN
jgi:hypothetical protein